jgi:hypothetical protein
MYSLECATSAIAVLLTLSSSVLKIRRYDPLQLLSAPTMTPSLDFCLANFDLFGAESQWNFKDLGADSG